MFDFFPKLPKLTEQEQLVLEVIDNMCHHEDTDIIINPSNMDYLISNKVLHFDVIITSNVVSITNSKYASKSQYPDKVIEIFKSTVRKKAIEERTKIIDSILEREKNLLLEVNQVLKIKK